MTGIVKAVTKKLEPEDPLKILAVDYQTTLCYKALIWSKRKAGQCLKLTYICICLTEFVILIVISFNP